MRQRHRVRRRTRVSAKKESLIPSLCMYVCVEREALVVMTRRCRRVAQFLRDATLSVYYRALSRATSL